MLAALKSGWPIARLGPNHGHATADLLPVLILVVVWLGMTAIANPFGEFPLNDDWVYALAVKSVVQTGHYQFPSASSANVGPQVFWGALFCLPFGFSFTALRISTLVLGLFGILLLYALVKRLTNERRTALIAALVMAANPFYFALANSFMTDVPFLVLTLAAVYSMLIGIESNSRWQMALGIAFAFAAILVRQLGIVILCGFVTAQLFKNGWKPRIAGAGVLLVLSGLVLHFGYQRWLVQTGRMPVLTVHASVSTLIPTWGNVLAMLKTFTASFLYSGFLLIPFAAQFWLSRPASRVSAIRPALGRSVIYGGLVIVLFGALFAIGKLLPASDNVLIKSGIGPLLLYDTAVLKLNRPDVPPLVSVAWGAVTVLALATLFTLIHLLWAAAGARGVLRSGAAGPNAPKNWKFALVASIAVSYFLILVLITGRVYIFDRYFLFFLPLGILMMSSLPLVRSCIVQPSGIVASCALIAVFAAFSVIATHDYLAWNRARWAALDDLMHKNAVVPAKIDGGYEFNGWFLYDHRYKEQLGKSWWWVVDNEYVIASGPVLNYSEFARYPFRRWLFAYDSNVFVLRKDGAGN